MVFKRDDSAYWLDQLEPDESRLPLKVESPHLERESRNGETSRRFGVGHLHGHLGKSRSAYENR
jgi:hypothetical protein